MDRMGTWHPKAPLGHSPTLSLSSYLYFCEVIVRIREENNDVYESK